MNVKSRNENISAEMEFFAMISNYGKDAKL